MSWDDLGIDAAGVWLIAAAVLAAAELATPGVFLVFVALGAAITGATLLLFPDMPLAGQLISAAFWTALAVVAGRRWYGRSRPSDDSLLNDRAARLLGEIVTVDGAIEHGRGRVRVGDGAWPARGPDAPVGTSMRVVDVNEGVLVVEPLRPPLR